jgi:tape measure domain-containing protein
MFQVAELVATLRLDKGNFDNGLRDSGSQLTGLGNQAQSTGSSLGGALANGMRAASVTAVGLAAATAATLKTLLSTGIAYNTLQQTSRAALTTLLGGAVAANEQMDKLDAFAKSSPFSKSTFITAQQQLIGFGMAAEKVIPTLNSVQNAVAAVGGSNDDIAAITSSLADVIGTGKITGDTLNELGLRGINAAEIIAQGFGTTSESVRKSIEKGTIDSAAALDILVAGMETKFAGAAANVKNTMTGATDRVKAATRDIGAALAEPFVSKYGGGRLVQWSNDWADALRAIEKKVPSVVSMMTDRLSPAMTGVSVVIQDAKAAIRDFDVSKIGDGMDAIASNLPAVAALTGAILGLTSGALAGIPVIGSLVGGLNPLAAALVGVVLATPELRTALGEVFGALEPLLPAVASLAGALSGALSEAAVAASPLLSGVATVLGVLAGALVPVVGAVASAAEAFSDLPPEVQSMITAFALFMAIRQPVMGTFGNIRDSAGDLVTKLRDGGLRGAITGITSLFGGPWGLAIGAATAVLGKFAAEQAETKGRVDDFTASLDANTGAITKNTSVIAGEKLMDYADTFKEIKLSAKDAADAVANGGAPYDYMLNKLTQLRDAVLQYKNSAGGDGSAEKAAKERLIEMAGLYGLNEEAALKLNHNGLTDLRKGMMGLRDEVSTSSENWKMLNVSQETAEPTTLRIADAIKLVGDETANTSDRLSAYRDIIDQMNGKTKSAEETQRDLAKSSRTLAGFLGEVDDAGNRVNASMAVAADGTIQFNDAGDRLSSMLEPLRDRGIAAAIAASDLAKAQGRNAAAATEADQALAPFRQTLQDLADQGLLTQEQVDALGRSLFGVPGETTAVISDGNSAAAVKIKVDELTDAIKATPNKEIVITEPLSPAIMEKLAALGYRVTTLPNGNIKVTETGTDATGAKIDATARKHRPAMIDVDAPSASVVNQILDNLARRRTAMIEVVYSGGAPIQGGPRMAVNDGYDMPNANGNLLEYYASGGMRHPRLNPMPALATIVPPNTWRVVGDNMKVPELYAPLDGSQRSLSLLREGVERSGFDMVPKGTRYFAEGGFAGSTQPIPRPVERQVHRAEVSGARPAPVYQFTGPVTVTNQAEFESMTRQRAADRNAALGIPTIEREI